MQPALDTVTASDFAPHVGTQFSLAADDAGAPPLVLTLTKAETLGQGRDGMRAPFSLLFAGPPDIPLPQGTYGLSHPALGELAIFLVPVSGDAQARIYQAVFN